jgi:hypothetical protein
MVLSSKQKNEIDSAYVTFSSERKYIQDIQGPWYEYLKESNDLCIQPFYKMSLKEISWVYVDWVSPAQDRDK